MGGPFADCGDCGQTGLADFMTSLACDCTTLHHNSNYLACVCLRCDPKSRFHRGELNGEGWKETLLAAWPSVEKERLEKSSIVLYANLPLCHFVAVASREHGALAYTICANCINEFIRDAVPHELYACKNCAEKCIRDDMRKQLCYGDCDSALEVCEKCYRGGIDQEGVVDANWKSSMVHEFGHVGVTLEALVQFNIEGFQKNKRYFCVVHPIFSNDGEMVTNTVCEKCIDKYLSELFAPDEN